MQVEAALKELYKTDSTDKNLMLDFCHPGQQEPFLRLWESGSILSESMELEESLSSDENLDFGSCEASQMKITVIGVEDQIKGSEMTVYQTLDGIYPMDDLYPGKDRYPSGYTMPLGRYVVQSAERQTNRRYRDIAALDFMVKFDVDVIGWYKSLPFPLSLRDFRARLCRHIGITEHVPDYLPNDGVMVGKTIDTEQLMGRDVLIACEQLNGVFGHFDREGVLQHVTLQPNYTLMPAADLYPSGELFPASPGTMNDQVYDERISEHLYRSCRFEEYMVRSIDKVQIRQEEGDIGAIYGTGTNCLTVEGNFLVFGKSAGELNDIARGIYGMVGSRQYIPYECDLKGLPYLEVGDTELIESEQGDIVSYVVKRTLKGIFALRDSHSATGEEIRSTVSNINTDIIQLKGKSAILKRNVGEVSANLIDLEAQTESMFKQTASEILAEVKRASEAEASLKLLADSITLSVSNLRTDMNSELTLMDNQISLKVSYGEVSSQLSVEPDAINLKTNRLSWTSDKSSMTVDGKLTCKEIKAVDGEFSGNIFGSAINGGEISVGPFYVDDVDMSFGDFYVSESGLYAGDFWVKPGPEEDSAMYAYQINCFSISCDMDIYLRNSSLVDTLKEFEERISDLESYL